MLAKRIGENIKAAREAKKPKWSLEKLAAKIEPPASYQQLSRLESAARPLTVEWIERIAKALELDPLELIAPERLANDRPAVAFSLDEQVANEVAQTLATVVLQGQEPEPGTVEALSVMLRELTATFSIYPQAAADPEMARPVVDLASRRFVPSAS